ncbi:hypothetical protein, partial [Pseudomonas corrugata]|uniref:hypothetical protein n=1 Tax=Pseudomonas corrugata TaxID=47879 RepID=UPI001F520AD7
SLPVGAKLARDSGSSTDSLSVDWLQSRASFAPTARDRLTDLRVAAPFLPGGVFSFQDKTS